MKHAEVQGSFEASAACFALPQVNVSGIAEKDRMVHVRRT